MPGMQEHFLGDWSMKQAEGFKFRLEALLISLQSGMADHDVEVVAQGYGR